MDTAVYSKLRKGKSKALKFLYDEELKRSWFICYHISEYEEDYVPLFIDSWKKTVEYIINTDEVLSPNFYEILYLEVFKKARTEIQLAYEDLSDGIKEPKIDSKYQIFVKGIDALEQEERMVHLLTTFGRLQAKHLAKSFEISESKMKEYMLSISSKAQDIPEIRKLNGATAIVLYTQFKSIGGSVFRIVEVPEILFKHLDNELQELVKSKKRRFIKHSAAKTDEETENFTKKGVGNDEEQALMD